MDSMALSNAKVLIRTYEPHCIQNHQFSLQTSGTVKGDVAGSKVPMHFDVTSVHGQNHKLPS